MEKLLKDLVRSPLHYNGNKFSIALDILEVLDKTHYTKIVEPFSGTGIISINSKATHIVLNDIDVKIINIMKYIREFSTRNNQNLLKIITEYNLTSDLIESQKKIRINDKTAGYSNVNRNGFNQIRKLYNQEKEDYDYLFLLINYSFNRMIRFNSKGDFNVPVGKSDYSSRQLKYLKLFQEKFKMKKVNFHSFDFCDLIDKQLKVCNKNDTIFYLDPPYLNGTAQYNGSWNEKQEKKLYNCLNKIHQKGFRFALSNTLYSNGKMNNVLNDWLNINDFTVKYINKKYSKTSHNKKNRYDAKEILVINF